MLTSPRLQETPRGARLLRRLSDGDFPLFPATDAAFASASDTEAPQGVLGVFEIARLPL